MLLTVLVDVVDGLDRRFPMKIGKDKDGPKGKKTRKGRKGRK